MVSGFLTSLVVSFSSVQGAKLSFENGEFVVTEGKSKTRITISTTPRSTTTSGSRIQFRRDQNFAVWDERGFSIRAGEKLLQTRFAGLLTNSNIQTKNQLAENQALKLGKSLALEAGMCVASRRVGDNAYFVIRFLAEHPADHRDFLVSVNLAASKPAWTAVARLESPFFDPGTQSTTLAIVDDALVWTESGLGSWSMCAWKFGAKSVKRTRRSGQLVQTKRVSTTLYAFIEASGNDLRTIGRFDMKSQGSRSLAEVRGSVSLLDTVDPWICLSSDNGRFTLHNLQTGSRMSRESPDGIARAGKNLLLWHGGKNPTSAVLLDPSRWVETATWTAPKINPSTTSKPPSKPTQKASAKPPAKPAPKPKKPTL